MPDIKFANKKAAYKYLNAESYVDVWKPVLKEMHRQVGNLKTENFIAEKGLLIRHLVMPAGVASSREIFEFISGEISTNTYINIMSQYHPCDGAHQDEVINRRIQMDEYQIAIHKARSAGLHRGF